nr:MAG TPA: hypothetical protein [Caudoviricetes sp.]
MKRGWCISPSFFINEFIILLNMFSQKHEFIHSTYFYIR